MRDDTSTGRQPPRAGGQDRPRAPRLVGRDTPRIHLIELVERTRSSGFTVCLVSGVAGLGKTRLVDEVLASVPTFARASARAYRWGATSSFGPWGEALDRRLRQEPASEVARLCGGSVEVLSDLLASVAPLTEGRSARAPRDRLLQALAELLDRMSEARPLVVALDDLHLADSSSWEALRFVARRLTDAPIAVLATARPNELAQRALANEVLLGLDDEGQLARIELEPLSRADVAELASAVLSELPDAPSAFVPEPLITWLMERSLGHPLFVIGLLRALVEEGADLGAPRLERLPTGLRDRVELDLRTIDDEDRDLLEVIAVVDRRVELDELGRITRTAPERLAVTLDRLARGWLLTEHDVGSGSAYEIPHPIVEDAIYEGIGTARRRILHRAVARALLDVGRHGEAATHLAQAAGPDDREAVDALCRAMAEAESRGLYQEAIVTMRALVDLLPAGDRRWRQVLESVDWLSDWVLSHLAENDAEPAITAMRRIDAQLDADEEPATTAAVQCHLAAFLSFGAGELQEAERVCTNAVTLFEAARETENSLLARNELAWIRGSGGDLAGQARLAGAALNEAIAGDHRWAAVQAACAAAYASGLLGRFKDAEVLYTRATSLATDGGHTYRAAWAMAQRGLVLSLKGDLDAAHRSIEAAFETDPRAADAIAFEDEAHTHWLAGRFQDALASLDRSAVRRPITGSRRRAWGAALAARIHLEAGRPERARTSLTHASTTYAGRPFLNWGFWEPWTRALLDLHDHGPEAAVAPLQAVADELREHGLATYEALVLTDLAEVAAAVGAGEHCAAAARRCVEIADATDGAMLPRAVADLVRGWSHLVDGAAAKSVTAATSATESFATHGYAFLHGTALALRGRAHGASDRAAAIADLRAAAEVFDGCGAVWRRERSLTELVRHGKRGRRAAAAVQGPASLTPREREVAALASQGYTAEQVAERLYIGRRTVESHLSSCYAKLGISTRGELIRLAAELRRPDGGSGHP